MVNCIIVIILYYVLGKIKVPLTTACPRQKLGRKIVLCQCTLLGPIKGQIFSGVKSISLPLSLCVSIYILKKNFFSLR